MCMNFGMKLIELESSKEQTILLKILRDHFKFNGKLYSFGCRKIKNEWTWVNSMKKVNFPLAWHNGQSDNYRGAEECLTVVKWN